MVLSLHLVNFSFLISTLNSALDLKNFLNGFHVSSETMLFFIQWVENFFFFNTESKKQMEPCLLLGAHSVNVGTGWCDWLALQGVPVHQGEPHRILNNVKSKNKCDGCRDQLVS